MYYTTATNTAFFPALNGAIAAIITVVFLRKSISSGTVFATCVATAGALLVIAVSSQGGGNPAGDFIALAAAAVYTVYIFVVDNQTGENITRSSSQLWAISCVEIIVMALLGWAALLVTGSSMGNILDNREVVISAIYVGMFTTFAPPVIALFFQRYVSPMTVALLYVLEPVWGAIAASIIENEVITLVGYVGGSLIVAGSIVNIVMGGRKIMGGRKTDSFVVLETQGDPMNAGKRPRASGAVAP